jgi:hypothetical protein
LTIAAVRSRSNGTASFSTSKPAARIAIIASSEIVTTFVSVTASRSAAPKKKSFSRASGPPRLAPNWCCSNSVFVPVSRLSAARLSSRKK